MKTEQEYFREAFEACYREVMLYGEGANIRNVVTVFEKTHQMLDVARTPDMLNNPNLDCDEYPDSLELESYVTSQAMDATFRLLSMWRYDGYTLHEVLDSYVPGLADELDIRN